MEIKTLGVVGAGQMGAGIAQVSAMSGMDVWLCDISDELIQKGLDGIRKGLDRMVSKEKISSDEADAVMGRLHKAPGLGIDVNSGGLESFQILYLGNPPTNKLEPGNGKKLSPFIDSGPSILQWRPR